MNQKERILSKANMHRVTSDGTVYSTIKTNSIYPMPWVRNDNPIKSIFGLKRVKLVRTRK